MKHTEVEIYNTHTGKIFVNRKKQLEFLSVGDYGKENNLKADFLGLTREIHGVKNTEVDLAEKWVATLSTQKGCPMKCKFCDCPEYGFHGNASVAELEYQLKVILDTFSDVKTTKRFNVHFARMGEPTFNNAVLEYAENEFGLRHLVSAHINADTIHPVVSTMLPKNNPHLLEFILRWCKIKNEVYKGEAGLQFSINSADDAQRNEQFRNMSLTLLEISDLAKRLPPPVGRKYTLNFAVTKDTVLDAEVLDRLFNKDHWLVKITPIHETRAATSNGFDIGNTYSDYDVYRQFEQPLLDKGWDVIVFVPSEEEDSDRITCGNALITTMAYGCEENGKKATF